MFVFNLLILPQSLMLQTSFVFLKLISHCYVITKELLKNCVCDIVAAIQFVVFNYLEPAII